MELTQKEKTLLTDYLEIEKLCVQKYKTYADESQDPEIKNLFKTLSNQEQQHVSQVTSLLQQGGFQPN